MKHILIVDDNTTNLRMAANVLQPFYEVSMAKSGRQALNFLKKSIPDLILLDILMPEMDGYETMEEIKLNPRTANIPIIFLTADRKKESEIKGLSLGALDFITKPFDEKSMLGRIEQVLMMDDMRRGLFKNTDRDSETGLYTQSYVTKKTKEYIDKEKNGVFILMSVPDLESVRSKAGTRVLASYMKFVYEHIAFEDDGDIFPSEIKDNLVLISVLRPMGESEIKEFANELIRVLRKDVTTESGKLTFSPVMGIEYIYPGDAMEDIYIRADKALYHALLTDGISYHIYKKV